VGAKHPTKGDVIQMILEPGVHHLTGKQALQYVRTRLDDGVYGRARRNQQFLKAVWDQTRDTDLVLKIPALWSALRDNFETDLSLAEVLALAPIALDLEEERVRSLYIGRGQTREWFTPNGAWVLVPNRDRVQQLVAALYAPPAEDPLADEAARVEVVNGTHRAQLELIAADQLQWEGLDVVATGSADHPDYAQTQIVVFNDKPQSLALLASLLEVDVEHISHEPDSDQPIDIRAILGADYDPCL
jgi:hypothetical protein